MLKFSDNNKMSMLLVLLGIVLTACHDKPEPAEQNRQAEKVVKPVTNPDVLPYLNERDVLLPLTDVGCKKRSCEHMELQSLETVDQALNQHIEAWLAMILQDLLGEEHKSLSLHEALRQYVQKSNHWQAEFALNQPYQLDLSMKIAYQRNQYVLLQSIVNAKQEELRIEDRGYFSVFDRKQKKPLQLVDILADPQLKNFESILQAEYQKWLKEQSKEVKLLAPKSLNWKQQEWFFDGQGIGVHYQANQIAKGAKQLDIFLSPAQTKQLLRPAVYQKMF